MIKIGGVQREVSGLVKISVPKLNTIEDRMTGQRQLSPLTVADPILLNPRFNHSAAKTLNASVRLQ